MPPSGGWSRATWPLQASTVTCGGQTNRQSDSKEGDGWDRLPGARSVLAGTSSEDASLDGEEEEAAMKEDVREFAQALLLAVCTATTTGGVGTATWMRTASPRSTSSPSTPASTLCQTGRFPLPFSSKPGLGGRDLGRRAVPTYVSATCQIYPLGRSSEWMRMASCSTCQCRSPFRGRWRWRARSEPGTGDGRHMSQSQSAEASSEAVVGQQQCSAR